MHRELPQSERGERSDESPPQNLVVKLLYETGLQKTDHHYIIAKGTVGYLVGYLVG